MAVKGGFSRFGWLYFFRIKVEASDAFNIFLIDPCADDAPSEVETIILILRPDNGDEWQEGGG